MVSRLACPMRRVARGFTLIELAVVIAIVGLLLGGILVPLATQIEVGRTKEARSDIDEIKEALYGFALANGRLPCPDSDDDGQEDRTGADNDCTAVEGQLPGVALGLATVDPWGAQYIYRVTNDFADDPVDAVCGATGVSFGLCTDGDITILDSSGGANVATAIPALVLSQGSNSGDTANVSPDELENDNVDATFVYKDFSQKEDETYDDVVDWVSSQILKNRMVQASLLP